MEADDLEGVGCSRDTAIFYPSSRSLFCSSPGSGPSCTHQWAPLSLGFPPGWAGWPGGGPKSELGYKLPDPCLAFLCQMWPLVLSSGGGSIPTALWPLALVGGCDLLALGYHTLPCWFSQLGPCLSE